MPSRPSGILLTSLAVVWNAHIKYTLVMGCCRSPDMAKQLESKLFDIDVALACALPLPSSRIAAELAAAAAATESAPTAGCPCCQDPETEASRRPSAARPAARQARAPPAASAQAAPEQQQQAAAAAERMAQLLLVWSCS